MRSFLCFPTLPFLFLTYPHPAECVVSEVGKLSVVSDIDEKGKLKTAPAEEAQQSSFLKFSNKDGLLKNFMTNFLKQFKEPKHFGLYKVLAENVEPGVIISKQRCKTEKLPRTNCNLKLLKCASMTSSSARKWQISWPCRHRCRRRRQ